MKKVKIVIGANFGDEGKGITTDFFCKQFPKKEKVLNIRFNGGSQAGHTVVTKDGKRHVFHNFGAGSFNENVITYISEHCFVEPTNYLREKEELYKLGVRPNVRMSHATNLILPWDVMLNQILEKSRGNNRHGSCGLGIWECLQRTKVRAFTPLSFRYTPDSKLKERLINIRDTYYNDRLVKEYNLTLPDEYKNAWYSEDTINGYIKAVHMMILDIMLVPEHEILKDFEYIVFEGAQGLLLDWDNREYMPHLTASHTGLKNVEDILKHLDEPYSKEICYITRTYFTRHGAGRFETETDWTNMRYKVQDKTNFWNEWQQVFRWGFFDLPLFIKTVQKDLEYVKGQKYKLSLSVTHCDETNGNFVLPDKDMPVDEITSYIKIDKLYKFADEITKK